MENIKTFVDTNYTSIGIFRYGFRSCGVEIIQNQAKNLMLLITQLITCELPLQKLVQVQINY